ncbi:hypothetical protein F4561_000072 [Lipingzhangella halophila]|uniref:DUF3180 domain-containing protein n=1 Tax=Lipingzhangella halophila TaxID=1783352 RepID=A0A7W7RC42_9ACTN|nr:DUF3180 domain-containing protein [Lipingzhangella halophila]MBB4929252.1 hypothetical protein [Lipingzhangella halophila]
MDKQSHQGSMQPTGWRLPLGIILVTTMLAYIVVDQAYGNLPLLPWTAIPTLALLAVGEAITAVHTRRRIRRVPGTEPVEPLSAARLLALAKASALLASLVIGTFGGMALALLSRLHAPASRADALTASGTLLAGGLLLGAALFLEYACRVPDEGRGEEQSRDE